MAHERQRHALDQIQKMSGLWPAVGVIGPRQVGKSTLLSHQIAVPNQVSLDDEEVLLAAENSAKVFISQLEPPIVIDEIQKCPSLFNALKARIDRKRRPGEFFVTGSTQFSARIGVRESLTGRIGLLELHPFTLAEIEKKPLRSLSVFHSQNIRFTISDIASAMVKGGLPMPCFLRDVAARNLYWRGWLDTTIHRDIARFFSRKYEARICERVLFRLAERALQGQYLTTGDLGEIQSRRLNLYLEAMEEVFLLRRIPCHLKGTGKDHWTVFDSGLLNFLLKGHVSEGATLSLLRVFLFNEISAMKEYAGQRMGLEYFKSARGQPVDLVWDGIPIKIIAKLPKGGMGWEKRGLDGAMKALGVKRGIICAPVERAEIKKEGISLVPWTYWS